MLNEIKAVIVRGLVDHRRKALTGPKLKLLFSTLTDQHWAALANMIAQNDSRGLGEKITEAVQSRISAQAVSEVEAMVADGVLTVEEIQNALNQ